MGFWLYYTTMSPNLDKNCRELFEIIMGLAREIRCCSRDEAICQDVTFHQFVILDAVGEKGDWVWQTFTRFFPWRRARRPVW